MHVHVILTGPPRVVLGRSAVSVDLPGTGCTLRDVVAALVKAEPRLASYFAAADRLLPPTFRLLLDDRVIREDAPIPDGATLTLLYALAGG